MSVGKEAQVDLAFGKHLSVAARSSEFLLEELRLAHRALVQAITDLDQLTRETLPTKARIVEARWNISRTSLARRMQWNRILQHLSCSAGRDCKPELRRLQENDLALLRASSAHVSRWNIDAVMKDWPGYCLASAEIRWRMKAAIGAEKRLLYPMLKAADR